MARVVIAPDGFGGTLSAVEAAEAIAAGWRRQRPADELVLLPLSDGGEGLLEVLEQPGDVRHDVEVAGPLGHPVHAPLLLRPDGSAVIETARACGLVLVPPERRNPLLTTTYGVGQLLDVARALGARRLLVGLGGSATVDGGAGALMALGYRITVDDGSGLKIGGDDLVRVAAIASGWRADWSDIEVALLADVTTPLAEAAEVFGPQKGATPQQVGHLRAGLDRWADVVERDVVPATDPVKLPEAVRQGRVRLREVSGTGAAGGLGYALAGALGADFRSGSEAVGVLAGLPEAIRSADLVVTGEGRLDRTTGAGKVVTHVASLARTYGLRVHAVVGQRGPGAPALDDVQEASPGGPPADPAAELRAAAARSATAWTPDG